ncbi:hypothetical protein [Pseudomonas yamanorum]|uniref:hypothetical protein n=1 Tax=Pseudomonas yamanorum TaxID=515393 RepID=UPI003B9F1178
MHDIIDFEVSLTEKNKKTKNTVFFFNGPDLLTPEEITHSLQHKLQRYVMPDHVAFLIPHCYSDIVDQQLKDAASDWTIALQRKGLSSITTYGIAYYDSTGQICLHETIGTNNKDLSKIILNSSDTIISAGLSSLAKKSQILERAPAGFLFSKPSSRASNYFIRAEALLTEAVNSHLIALACLKHIKVGDVNFGPQVIYLDTVSFLPVALSIKLYWQIFKIDHPLSIQSFKSYDGVISSVASGPVAICLISASTNCGLAEKWIEANGTDPSRIITILSFLKESDNCSIVLTLPKPADFSSSDGTDPRQLIRIQGERFVAQHSETKVLNISTYHAHSALQDYFERFAGKGIFSCFGKDTNGGHRTVWVNKESLSSDGEFKTWLNESIVEEVSASTTTIIYDDDSASKTMAEIANDCLVGYGLNITGMHSFKALENLTSFEGGALILAAAAERGSKLLGVSRRLRSLQKAGKGTRVYLVGALHGRSYDQMKELASNLTQPPRGAKRYTFKAYFELPVSNPNCNKHWHDEQSLVSRIISQHSRPPQFIVDRDREIRAAANKGLLDTAFWPSSETKKSMKITRGFAFVSDKTNVTSSSCADIFATINWVLQNARQSAKVEEGRKLLSVELQQVLLSPEVFSRFDDGIIQAAFLRAAHPAELDYSEHDSLSWAFADIIKRVVAGYGQNRGEAAMEFIIALSIGKVKLHPSVYNHLKIDILDLMKDHISGLKILFDGNDSTI